MRTLLSALLIALVISGCSQAEQKENTSPDKILNKNGQVSNKNSLEEAEKVIKALLNPLSTRGIKVKSVKATQEVKVPGFKTFEVDLIDNRNHRELKRYIFINTEDKYIALQIFKYSIKGKSVILQTLKPKNAEKPLKVNISFIKEIDKELTRANIPHVVGKGEKKVYIVWDVFCPFCYGHFNQVEEIAKKNNVEIHMIPLAVHGENSIKGLVYYTKLAREKGTAEALKELYNMGNGDFMKYAKTLENKIKRQKEITPDQEKIIKTIKDIEVKLVKNGVRATPTLIYAPPGENRGTIHVGFMPIDKLIKEK